MWHSPSNLTIISFPRCWRTQYTFSYYISMVCPSSQASCLLQYIIYMTLLLIGCSNYLNNKLVDYSLNLMSPFICKSIKQPPFTVTRKPYRLLLHDPLAKVTSRPNKIHLNYLQYHYVLVLNILIKSIQLLTVNLSRSVYIHWWLSVLICTHQLMVVCLDLYQLTHGFYV